MVLNVLVIFLVLVLAAVHFHLTESDVKPVLRRLLAKWQEKNAKIGERELEKGARLEKELLNTRCSNFQMIHRFAIHLNFLASLATMLGDPSFADLSQLMAPLSGYAMHACIQTGVLQVKTNSHVRIVQALCVCSMVSHLAGAVTQTEIEVLASMEKMSFVSLIFVSVVFVDLKMTFPVYVAGALVLTYKHWELLRHTSNVAPLICSTLVSHVAVLAVLVVIVYTLQSYIAEKLDSDDTSSLLLAFRRVLRGLCDGDLVLDRRNYRIVDDASYLERLLNTNKKLSETDFLDLFLDSEGRQRFLEFLDRETSKESQANMPSCLRIALQGAAGPVSTDVFVTSCGAAARDYYLLAFRVDPEQFIAPPDAPPDAPPVPTQTGQELGQELGQAERAASSVEVLEAFKELVQVAILVNTETPAMDIEEVTLSFERSSASSSGMPTLRSFIRINDWERVEQVFNTARSSESHQVRFPSPLLFRIPGTRPRGYLLARLAAVFTDGDEGDESAEAEAASFSLHLSALEVRHSRRRKEQDLESINEWRQPCFTMFRHPVNVMKYIISFGVIFIHFLWSIFREQKVRNEWPKQNQAVGTMATTRQTWTNIRTKIQLYTHIKKMLITVDTNLRTHITSYHFDDGFNLFNHFFQTLTFSTHRLRSPSAPLAPLEAGWAVSWLVGIMTSYYYIIYISGFLKYLGIYQAIIIGCCSDICLFTLYIYIYIM